MREIIFVIMMVFAVSVAYPQKRNDKGLKMVRRLQITWKSNQEKYIDWLSWDITFFYEDSGKLKGIDKKSVDGGNVFLEQYRREGEVIGYASFKNGRKTPHSTVKFDYDMRSNAIRKRVDDYAIYYEDGEIAYWKKDIFDYSRYKVHCRSYSNYHETFDSIKGREDAITVTNSIKTEWKDETLGGLEKVPSFAIGTDGYIYHVENDNIVQYTYMDGNMQPGIVRDYDEFYKRTVYLDRLNDTNIEFYPLSRTFILSSYYGNVECITEWGGMHSKNLVSITGKWGKSFDSRWSYCYDGKGNINQIDILCKEWGSSHCSIKIEYVE